MLLVLFGPSASAPTEAVLRRIAKALMESPARLAGGPPADARRDGGGGPVLGGANPGADLEALFAKAEAAMYETNR